MIQLEQTLRDRRARNGKLFIPYITGSGCVRSPTRFFISGSMPLTATPS